MSNFHDLINNNFPHPDYGKLLHHRDLHNPNILHYSVQLNDWESIAWEPMHSDSQKDTGRLAIWPIDWSRFQTAKWVSYWKKERINQALHISVAEFHERWQYELYRFNCEHWARLVTTGNCCCYQITEFKKLPKIPVLGVIVVGILGCVTGAWEHNRLLALIRKLFRKCICVASVSICLASAVGLLYKRFMQEVYLIVLSPLQEV